MNDLPHADGLAALSAAAGATTRIELGVGVVPLDQRPPDTIAATIEASGLPRHRLVLGVGSGGSDDALARVRAGVEALRGAAAKVVVGALGPRMSELAGEVADGVLLNWLTPEHAERSARWVLGAAAVRGPAATVLLGYVRCGLLPGAEGRLARGAGALRRARRSSSGTSSAWERSAADTCVLRDDAACAAGRHRPRTRRRSTRRSSAPSRPTTSVDSLLRLLRACAP